LEEKQKTEAEKKITEHKVKITKSKEKEKVDRKSTGNLGSHVQHVHRTNTATKREQ